MQRPLGKFPPMAALRPFEAAARHLSFTKAASELCVTQAAVSRQVRKLEQFLDTKLFLRQSRSVKLTSEGSMLFGTLSPALFHIAETTAAITSRAHDGRLNVAMRLAFAGLFIAPRIGKFRGDNPSIELDILAVEGNPSRYVRNVDVAITLGFEPDPDLHAEFLFPEEIYPVCSASYLTNNPEIRTLDDLKNHTMVHLSESHWSGLEHRPITWKTFLEATGSDLDSEDSGLVCNNYEIMIPMILAGQGVGLGWRHLVQELVDNGSLMRPLNVSYKIDRGHYLVVQKDKMANPDIRAFVEWLIAQTAHLRC